MCQPKKMFRHEGMASCTCGYCGCGPSFRRFYSTEEQREYLENYRNQLKKELAGVEEQINKLGN